MNDRQNEMKADKLESITRDLRRMFEMDDNSEAAANVSAALVYLDCAKLNLTEQGDYKVSQTIVACGMIDPGAEKLGIDTDRKKL